MDKVFEYQNNGGAYYEIVPSNIYQFASSGVIANSTVPDKGYDRIVAVYGKKIKLHIFGESSENLIQKHKTGRLWNKKEIL